VYNLLSKQGLQESPAHNRKYTHYRWICTIGRLHCTAARSFVGATVDRSRYTIKQTYGPTRMSTMTDCRTAIELIPHHETLQIRCTTYSRNNERCSQYFLQSVSCRAIGRLLHQQAIVQQCSVID